VFNQTDVTLTATTVGATTHAANTAAHAKSFPLTGHSPLVVNVKGANSVGSSRVRD